MKKEFVFNELQGFREDLIDGLIPKQRVLNNHLKEVMELLNKGVPHAIVYEAINLNLPAGKSIPNIQNYYCMFRRAKINKNKGVKIIEKATIKTPNEKQTESVLDWSMAGVSQPRLRERLEENGYTPEQVLEWKLENEVQISRKLSMLLMKTPRR